jgi:hypothetical protein
MVQTSQGGGSASDILEEGFGRCHTSYVRTFLDAQPAAA